ncbi:MAG: hypothetical protein A3G81_31065 [Betaproteobacteria bacterium RIFCSPLOWO2_12_FULL_65_14]|nr:MAG: hypothetical protein A3G81_31065 [Betaproteobacteria bacterium RIFCSPLOWO2_12_FULL_65_14]
MAAVAAARAPEPRKLRVGVFADARLQPRWVVEAFEQVARSDFAEIVLIAAAGERGAEPWLRRAYRRIERLLVGGEPEECADLGTIREPGAEGDALKQDLDVAFVLGEADDSRFDGIARYGVWRFWFGSGRGHAEPLAGWREVAEGAPATGSGVKVRLRPGTPPRLAYESWSRTYPLSVERNRARLLAKAAQFPARALRELARSGEGWLEQCRSAREAGPPEFSGMDLLRTASSVGGRALRRGLEKALHVEQWFIAFRFGEKLAVAPDLKGYVRMLPPKDRIWADPFAIEKNGRHFVFFEELPFAAAKGHIAMVEVKRDGTWSSPQRVLERDYHLSYPFLLELDGELYMVPESAQNRSVEVYRCVDFPLRWKREKTLLDGVRLVDATFHRGAERWWMFANAAVRGSNVFDDELHLFHSESLLGPWRAHPRNPVKSDARCSRPAGQLFWRGGALHRPAQICVPRYGAGLAISRVLRLTPQDYAERQVERVLPAEGLLGLHTVNRAGSLTVVDAFARRRRFA